MTCLACDSAHQRGRFCNRCGSKRPPNIPAGGTWAVRRLPTRNRADATTRTAAPTPPDPQDTDAVRCMYDFALARAGSPGGRSLDRYLAVLIADPRTA